MSQCVLFSTLAQKNMSQNYDQYICYVYLKLYWYLHRQNSWTFLTISQTVLKSWTFFKFVYIFWNCEQFFWNTWTFFKSMDTSWTFFNWWFLKQIEIFIEIHKYLRSDPGAAAAWGLQAWPAGKQGSGAASASLIVSTIQRHADTSRTCV